MFQLLFLLFVTVPLIELAVLVYLAQLISLPSTILLVIVTGVVGAWLARQEGFQVWLQLQADLQRGIPPGQTLMDGACVLAGGLLLLTPGVLTDIIGFALLVPWSRRGIQHLVRQRLQRRMREQGGVVDVQYHVLTDEDDPRL